MTERQLYECQGKKIKVTFNNGSVQTGECFHFTQALDNEPEVASISLRKETGPIEIDQTEIKSIAFI